ncbi:P-loop containing nucleoside triphosphate hydrolase protein [Mycena crocata]|nr:P-loop containing nucleoside triphosphate hydrolase protein [Mycena crocata]
MASRYRWRDPEGVRTLDLIVKKEIPQWKDGLYPTQRKLILLVLDGHDILCCMATGGGKSAIFAVPIIILREMVLELKNLGVPAFAYCHDTVTEARKAGRNLVLDIKQCKTWNIICVDPEHLRDKAWREISAYNTFRTNILFGCVDEAHLIDEWGAQFRPMFKHIGAFFRGRLPSSSSVMALSATIQTGAHMDSICHSLGLSGANFHLVRCSNERPNTQFIMELLDHGLGGNEFPCLLPYLNSRRKAVVHVRTMDDVWRVYEYLWYAQTPSVDRLKRVQMYSSIRTPEDNEEILRMLDKDPMCQVVVATVAFSNGLNIKPLLDSLSLGFPDTVDQLWQEKGRVGRDPDTSARGVVFLQPSVLADARKQIAGVIAAPSINPQTGKAKRVKKTKPMEHAKALILVEKECYIAAFNRIYQNPPLDISTLDCIAAERRLPCSLCAARNETTLTFSPSPLPPGISLPPFVAPSTESAPLSAVDKKLKLTTKEREMVEAALTAFGETVRRAERKDRKNQNRPKSSFFPSSLTTLHRRPTAFIGFPCCTDCSRDLMATINSQREEARLAKNARQRETRRAKKAACDTDSDEGDDEDSQSSDISSSSETDRGGEHPPAVVADSAAPKACKDSVGGSHKS